MDNCKNKCLVEYYDRCLKWTGPDIACVNILSGEYYDEAIVKLATRLCDFINTEVNLKCLYDNTCGNCSIFQKIPDAVQILIDKICKLTTSDIKHNGSLYCLGHNTMSPAATQLLNKTLSYNLSPHPVSGTTLSYNIADGISDMPDNFVVSRISSIVKGVPSRGVSTLVDSDKDHVGVTIKNDRFPLDVNIEVLVNSPTGTIKLYKNLHLSSTKEINNIVTFDVKDYTSEESKEYTQQTVNDLLASEVCNHRTQLESFKYIDVVSGDCLVFPSTDIKDVVSVLSGGVEDICHRLTDLEKVTIKDCNECGEVVKSVTVQEAFDILSESDCKQDEKIKKLEKEIEELKKLIASLGASSSVANSGGISGGGCPNGNCN